MDKKQLKENGMIYWKSSRGMWIAILFGILSFFMIYGFKILNPVYTDWLLNGLDGDLSQHYLGWKFFREDSWHFPIGIMENIAYPNRVSIIFTDSIPLFALLFKLLGFMLPEQFQYFGLWGLLCFIMQASLSYRILKRYLKTESMAVLGSLFFVFAPVMIDRMYWMTSLAAHWLCLLGIELIESHDKLSAAKWKGIVVWGLFGALCASIHLYFLPMGGILLLGYCLVVIWKTKKVRNPLFSLLGYLIGAVAVTALLGGFSSNMGLGSYGLGDYSFNLNGFFNPTGRFYFWSRLLPAQPQYIDNQYEGFAYLGFGMLFLLGVTLIHWVGSAFSQFFSREKEARLIQWDGKIIAYVLVIALSILAAASPVITYNEKTLLNLPIPGFVRSIWEMFRASGRLVWPAVYLLMIWGIAGDALKIKKEVKAVALVLCLALQLYDCKDVLIQKKAMFQTEVVNESALQSEMWQRMAMENGIRHITFMSDFVPDQKLLFSFGEVATDYGMTINDFYFARPLGDAVEKARQSAIGAPAEDTVFVFYQKESQNCLNYDLHYYMIDGLIAGTVKPLGYLEELSEEALSAYYFSFENNQYVNNGEDIDGVRYLYSYGNSYGPYLNAEPGLYEVRITGSGLSGVELQCHYARGDSKVEIQNPQITDSEITYRFELMEPVEDLECLVWNVGGSEVVMETMEIIKQAKSGH